MGGLSGVVKAGAPKNLREVLEVGAPGTKSNTRRQKDFYNAFWKPQPYEGEQAPRRGPFTSAMSAEDLEEARRRRGTPRRPTSTVLTAGTDGETLGG